MESFLNSEYIRPSRLMIASGLGIMVLAELIPIRELEELQKTAGKVLAISGVITAMFEQKLFEI